MKLFCALLCSIAALAGSIAALAAAAPASVNPQLHEVKRVYLLGMGSGMDQFLADQLTRSGVFEVVTDPQKADAILTDNVGEAFQKKLDDLYPPPPAPKKAPEATAPAADTGTSLDVGDSSDTKPAPKDRFADVDFSGGGNRVSTLGRGKGNFFVVDRNSRVVLWSVYEHPKNSTPGELTKSAARAVKHLKDDLTNKKPAE